jgi:DNA-binding LacI/PurR family transcriptional regulator
VAFASFDNFPFTRHAYPPLATVDTRGEHVGEVAMTRQLAAMRGEMVDGLVSIEPRLSPRESAHPLGD